MLNAPDLLAYDLFKVLAIITAIENHNTQLFTSMFQVTLRLLWL